MIGRKAVALTLAAGTAAVTAVVAWASPQFSDWAPAALVDPFDAVGVNTPAQDGCPIQSPDGLNLYIASNRAGSAGLDLWVAQRGSSNEAWGDPINLNGMCAEARRQFLEEEE